MWHSRWKSVWCFFFCCCWCMIVYKSTRLKKRFVYVWFSVIRFAFVFLNSWKWSFLLLLTETTQVAAGHTSSSCFSCLLASVASASPSFPWSSTIGRSSSASPSSACKTGERDRGALFSFSVGHLEAFLEQFSKVKRRQCVSCRTRFEPCQIFSLHPNATEKVTGLTACLIRIKMDHSELPQVSSVTLTHICIPVSALKPVPELAIGANTGTSIG